VNPWLIPLLASAAACFLAGRMVAERVRTRLGRILLVTAGAAAALPAALFALYYLHLFDRATRAGTEHSVEGRSE
jgi:hypothetical protein